MNIAYVSKQWALPMEQLANQHTAIEKLPDLQQFISFYEQAEDRDIALLYEVEQAEEIRFLRDIPFKQNIYITIVGPADPALSLLSGKVGADAYLFRDDFSPEALREQLINSRKNIKERMGTCHVSALTGIHGGIGTTTIAANLSKLLSETHAERKVLFIDLATAKAISNLFFDIPHPKKTLVDVALSGCRSTEEFGEILVKSGHNLYFLPGIQKPSDRRNLEHADDIQRILDFIEQAKEYFNDIIIDTGVFENIPIKERIHELCDSLYIIVEFSIPSLAILMTQLEAIFREGLAPKTHLLINRYDAQGTFDVDEAIQIIRKNELYPFKIDYMLPNDSKSLRESWNEAKLVSELFPNTAFVTSLTDFARNHFVLSDLPGTSSSPLPERPKGNPFLRWLGI